MREQHLTCSEQNVNDAIKRILNAYNTEEEILAKKKIEILLLFLTFRVIIYVINSVQGIVRMKLM